MLTELKLQEYLHGVRACVAPFGLKDAVIIWDDAASKSEFDQPKNKNIAHEVKVWPVCHDADEHGNEIWVADNEIPDSFDVVVRSDNINREIRMCFRPMDYYPSGLEEYTFNSDCPAIMDYHPSHVENSQDDTTAQAFDDAIHFALGLQIAYDISCGGLAKATLASDAAMMSVEKPSREFLALIKHNDKTGFYATTMALIPTKLDEEYAALIMRGKRMEIIPVSAVSVINRDVFVGQVSWFEIGAEKTVNASRYTENNTTVQNSKKRRIKPV